MHLYDSRFKVRYRSDLNINGFNAPIKRPSLLEWIFFFNLHAVHKTYVSPTHRNEKVDIPYKH